MKTKFIARTVAVIFFSLIALLTYAGGAARAAFLTLFSGGRAALAQEAGMSKVIFKVKCYDDGKAALRGLKGVHKVETGFHYIQETDTVYYDPKLITIREMETALKKAGTYVDTIQ
jgi:copper chaperone CopZ